MIMPFSTAPDINFSSGGFDGYPQVGRWKRPNGEQIFVSKYWQSTIQFVGNGATFNIYPAHCTVYILSKGENTQVTVGGNVEIQGPGHKCLGSSSNIDVGVIYFGRRS